MKYIIYRDYCTDIGWDKAYYNEDDPDDSRYSWGCPIKEATVFNTSEEAKERCDSLNDDDFCDCPYRFTLLD